MRTDALPLPDLALLPDDPAVLKQLVVQLLEELQKANARLERQEHHMDLLRRRLYGSTSEKFDPRQSVLFDAQGSEEEVAASPPPVCVSPVCHKFCHKFVTSSRFSKTVVASVRGPLPDEEALLHHPAELTQDHLEGFGKFFMVDACAHGESAAILIPSYTRRYFIT